jgi:hypothetical protein
MLCGVLFLRGTKGPMRRRDFVRAVIAAAAAPKLLLAQNGSAVPPPAAPVPWTLGLSGVTPIPHTQIADAVALPDVRFFTPVQMATLERLSDVLVPPFGDKPGAIQAETPAFLDFFIGSSPADRRQMYRDGLDWLDAEAQKQFSMPFAKLEATQADRILQPWMRTWMSDHPPIEAHADFINIAHADIRSATINSRAWSDAPVSPAQESTSVELYWSPIEPDIYSSKITRMISASRTGRAAP